MEFLVPLGVNSLVDGFNLDPELPGVAQFVLRKQDHAGVFHGKFFGVPVGNVSISIKHILVPLLLEVIVDLGFVVRERLVLVEGSCHSQSVSGLDH